MIRLISHFQIRDEVITPDGIGTIKAVAFYESCIKYLVSFAKGSHFSYSDEPMEHLYESDKVSPVIKSKENYKF